ncbi:MAG: RDD family protein [Saprospiraceae bacterium]
MQTIDITTTQNVTIEYELATLRERILAFVIDVLVVWSSYLIVFIALFSQLGGSILDSGLSGQLIVYLLPVGLLIAYQLISEVAADGQSWGKKAMGIKVVRLDGEEPSLVDYLLRAVFLIIDFLLSFGIIAALLISSTVNSQRLGDMTANTTVIRVRFNFRFRLEDILKINTLDDYEPSYPEVRQLSEQDMLLIKTVISRYQKHRNEAHKEVINDLTKRLGGILQITDIPKNKIEFLKTLIRDYIVLTR